MNRRSLFVLLLLTLGGLVGFAPAPFPRPQRTAKIDDMERIQGLWRMTYQESSGTQSPHNYKVRVKGDRWTFISINGNQESPGSDYFLRLNQGVSPPAMEWAYDKEGSNGWIASYRFEGNRLTVIYDSGTMKNNLNTRPTDFTGRVPHKMAFEYVGREG